MSKSYFTYALIIFFIALPIVLLGQSRKLVRKGKRVADPKQQIAYFTNAIELDSENLDAYFYRGIARSNLEDHWGAILDFTKIIFKKPDADSFYNRGNSRFALGNYQGAYEDYLTATKLNKYFFKAYYNLGITQHNLKKYKEALKVFGFLLSYFPNDENIYIQIGLAFMELKHYNSAIMFLNKSIELEKNSDTLHNRGIAYLRMKAYGKAAADFTKAINLDKRNDSAYYYLGISQMFSRDFTKAVTSFKNTLSFNSLDHEALMILAIAYYHTNNLDEARDSFRKAKSILYHENMYIDDISLLNNIPWDKHGGQVFKAYFNKLNML